jgi:ankyrin repeat protein
MHMTGFAAVLLVAACGLSLAQGPSASSDGTTPLHWAVHNNDVEGVDRLIKAGANVNAKNEHGATAMSLAAATGNTTIIERLLKAGADPDSPHADGQTALMVIARSTNVKAARLLLDHGANVNAVEQQRKQTALMWAAAQGQSAMVKELIARGADVNARAFVNPTASAMFTDATPMDWPSNVSVEPRATYRAAGGLTPLLYAAREGCVACAKELIAGGADLDMPDPEGITPLIMAITNMHFDTAALLINAGANVDKWDWWGRSPLYQAVDVNTIPRGGRPDRPSLDETTSLQIIEMLLEKGANPNLQLKLLPPYRNVGADRGVDRMLTIGATPLLRAAKALDAPAIERLLKKGALPNLPNILGTTPVMAAAGLGSVDADTRGVFTTEDTPQRSVAALKLLLDAGGDIHLKDNIRGQTPLHGAAFWGWNDAVKFLVERGADLNAKDSRGMTPVDAALGKAGGNSRGGQRIDVHEGTAALLRKLMAEAAAKTVGQ